MSLDQVDKMWCTKKQYNKQIVVGASSNSDGKVNTDKVMSRSDSAQYPPFVWCRAKGKDWYLPARDELMLLYSVGDTINSTLNERGGNTIFGWYWSSTEGNVIGAWVVSTMHGGDTSNASKCRNFYVRAVSAF